MDTESEDELFEFHLAELVQARYEGREMRRLLVRSQRLGVHVSQIISTSLRVVLSNRS